MGDFKKDVFSLIVTYMGVYTAWLQESLDSILITLNI